MDSSSIPLTAFRQILILPLTLASVESGKKVPVEIHALADRLRNAAGSDDAKGWIEIDDHLKYLGGKANKSAYAEFVYFHGYIQDFLYDRVDPNACGQKRRERSLRLFERKSHGAFDVALYIAGKTLDRPEEKVHVSFRLPIERLNLYLFELGVAILVVEVATGMDPKVRQCGEEPALSLAHAQALQNALRRIYPPYFLKETIETDSAHEIPEYPACLHWSGATTAARKPSEWIKYVADKRRNPIDPVWSALLAPLAVEGESETGFGKWRQIIDERIPSMLFLGVRDASGIEPHDFERLCFCDEPARSPFYSEEFMQGYEKEYCYERHWHGSSGTLFMFSGYSMVMLGTGKPEENDIPGKDDDFFHYVLGEHFRRHYFQMGLLIQLQFAALLSLSHRVSVAVSKKRNGSQARFRRDMVTLEGEFLEFEQRYWFSQISNQLQAREIYGKWLGKTNVANIYHEVRDQVRAANDYLDARAQEAQTEAANRLAVIATFGIIAGAALAFLGMNVLASQDFLAALGVPKELGATANAKNWRGVAEMVSAHAAVFLTVVTLSIGLGRTLLRRYGDGGERTSLAKQEEWASLTDEMNKDLGKIALWCGIGALVSLLIHVLEGS